MFCRELWYFGGFYGNACLQEEERNLFIGIDLFVAELPPLDAWLCIGVINSIKGNIIEWGWIVSLVMSQKRTLKVYS